MPVWCSAGSTAAAFVRECAVLMSVEMKSSVRRRARQEQGQKKTVLAGARKKVVGLGRQTQWKQKQYVEKGNSSRDTEGALPSQRTTGACQVGGKETCWALVTRAMEPKNIYLLYRYNIYTTTILFEISTGRQKNLMFAPSPHSHSCQHQFRTHTHSSSSCPFCRHTSRQIS